MANLQRLLTRRPQIDEAELEDVRERTMARLAAFGGEVPEAAQATPITSTPEAPQVPGPGIGATPVVAETESPTASPIESGPKVIVPRTIELGPPRAVAIETEPHRPPIIVTGDIEPEAIVVEIQPVEIQPVEIEAATPTVVDPPTPQSAGKSASVRKKRPATPKRATRPPEAVPVVAQPTPVIRPDEVWPGRWLRDVSPERSVRAEPIEVTNARPMAAAAVLIETAEPVAVLIEPVEVAEPLPVVAEAPAVVEAIDETPAAIEVVAEAILAPSPEPIKAAAMAASLTPTATVPRVKPKPRAPKAGRRPAAKLVAARGTAPPAPTIAAFCPYCALALDPAPTASRRCTRCRQRIVVKRVQGRVVLLTEAAVTVFDSERLRSANFGRWSRERAQWLKLAASVQADAARIGRLGAAPLSEKVVASARTLYLSTAERQFRDAKREDRWEDASHMKRDQANAMHRLAGSPLPPAPDVLALYREAVATELRGIGKMAKEAGLVGSDCCDTCRVDDGRTFRIALELRDPRLPHDGCPRGLCRCRWDLTLRDRTMVQRYLRRTSHSVRTDPPTD